MKTLTQKILLLLFLLSSFSLFSQSVDAVLDASEYNVGDEVDLNISLKNIADIHGVYFNLNYDSEYFSFEGLYSGDIAIGQDRDLLYSVSEFQKSHIIVSFSLKDSKASVNATQNNLVKVRFKVVKKSVNKFSFTFSDNGIKKNDGTKIPGLTWNNTPEVSIVNDFNTGYVAIKNPYENQVFYSDNINFDVISTPGTGYYCILENLNSGDVTTNIPSDSGYISDYTTPIVVGFNKFKITLYNAQGLSLDEDFVNVYKSDSSTGIKITSPGDHTVVNTNLITVNVNSSFENVLINGNKVVESSRTDGDSFKGSYSTDIWLKKGFNKIKAEAKNAQGALFTHEIDVYYQEDDSIFTIIPPNYGEVVKSNDTNFKILGEISSKYESKESSFSSNMTENKVTLSMVYYPEDMSGRTILFKDKPLVIRNRTEDEKVRTRYVFSDTVNLKELTYLASGRIEITAYKNRNTPDEVSVTSLVNIDDSEVKIELIQPNIFNNDVIDSDDQFTKLTTNGSLTNVSIANDGSYKVDLKTDGQNVNTVNKPDKNSPISIKDSNDTLWYITNSYSKMTIKSKKKDETTFTVIKTVNNMYGYTISETSLGMLIGVSNLYNNENSGLYLLDTDTNQLKNIRINEPLPHVQFIKNYDGQIFLYGNNFDYIYSFNTQNLEESSGYINSTSTGKIPLNIDYNIKDIQITSDLKMAVVLDELGKIKFYQNQYNTGFEEVYITDFDYDSEAVYSHVIKGEYRHSDYNAFLLIGDKNRVIMQNKNTGTLKCSDLNWNYNTGIVGADFHDDNFVIVARTSDQFVVLKGSIHFGNFTENIESTEIYGKLNTYDIRSSVFASKEGIYIDSIVEGRDCLNLAKAYMDNGNISFTYNNQAVDGVTGFSFYTEPGWLESNIRVGITLEGTTFTKNSISSYSPNNFIEEIRNYRDGDLEYVEFVFKKLVKNFALDMDLISRDYQSPFIKGLQVNNKAPFKLIKSEGNLSMPIRGTVNDPTVKKVTVNGNPVSVINGTFSTIQSLLQADPDNSVEILISAKNSIGEEAIISFNVDMIDSYNGIDNIKFNVDNTPGIQVYDLISNLNKVTVSGDFYGLKGAILGYELYKGTNSDLDNTFIMRSGIIKKSYDLTKDLTQIQGITQTNKKFYEAGTFNQAIKLNPGKQTLIIYIENPGGLRTNIARINDLYPEIAYDLPVSDQKIDIASFVEEEIYESLTFPYVYEKDIVLTGEIISPFTVDELVVDIVGEVGTFGDDKKEIRISVNSDNSFEIPFNVKLPDECEFKDILVNIKPNTPFLDNLKTSVAVNVKKNFEYSNIIPDFTLMDSWELEEKKKMSKLITLVFDRFIPEGTELSMLVNFNKYIKGKLKVADNTLGTYYLVDEYNNPISLSGIRLGSNRINWTITYNGYVISSSNNSGQSEYTFNFDLNSITFDPTLISFTGQSLEGADFTSIDELPILNITKDKNTQLNVVLNGKEIWEDGDSFNTKLIDLKQYNYLEGKNRLEIEYTVKGSQTERVEYGFTYDSKSPLIGLESEIYSEDGSTVTLSFLVLEANLNSVTIAHNGADSLPDSIESVGSDRYRVKKKNLPFTINDTIQLKANDHSNRSALSDLITLTGKLAEVTTMDNKNIDLPKFNNEQTFQADTERPVDPDFSGPYSKVFPSVIKLESSQVPGSNSFTITNVQKVELNQFSHGQQNLEIQGYEIELNPGYESQGEVTFSTSADLNMDTNKWAFNHDKDSEAVVFSFWFRDESQNYYLDSNVYKVLTLDANNTIFCDGSTLYLNSSTNKLPIPKDKWSFIGVKVQDGSISITKRDDLSAAPDMGTYTEVTYPAIDITNITKAGVKYQFGADNAAANGYFSVALPYYVNNKLKNTEGDAGNLSTLEEIYNFVRVTSSSSDSTELDRIYSFNIPEEQGLGFRQYKPVKDNSDILSANESADYSVVNGKSLIASSVHNNILSSTESGVGYVNASSQVTNSDVVNLTVFQTADSFLLSPINLFVPGRYYFDSVDSESSRGLEYVADKDNNFTLSGRIIPYDAATDIDTKAADVIVKVDFDEYRYPVDYGDFRVNINSQDLNISNISKVHIYIETENRIYLNKNIKLNRGAYVAPVVKTESAVQFETRLNSQGTVAFWYKPFNIGLNGFSSYESVLFENDYIRIYTSLNPESGVTEYKAEIGPKGTLNVFKLGSAVPVEGGWQHIQLSFSQPDGRATLYINGELAINGNQPYGASETSISYRSFLGCSQLKTDFAQGYIDDFLISPFYKPSIYKDSKPFSYNYVEDPKVDLEVTGILTTPDISLAEYILESGDREYKKSVLVDTKTADYSTLPFDFDSLEPGRYTLRTKMTINGYNFDNTEFFIRNDKPLFILEDYTSFIIPRKSGEVKFRLRHDKTVHIDNSGNKKSGIKIELTGQKSSGELFTRDAFLYQTASEWNIKWDDRPVAEVISKQPEGYFDILFNHVESVTDIQWVMTPYYFEVDYKTPLQSNIKTMNGLIPKLNLVNNITEGKLKDGTPYKLIVDLVSGNSAFVDQLLKDIKIRYEITSLEDNIVVSTDEINMNNTNGIVELYYDDFLKNHGKYKIYFSVYYLSDAIHSKDITVEYKDTGKSSSVITAKNLNIDELSFISIEQVDSYSGKAKINFKYSYNAIPEAISYTAYCYSDEGEFSKSSQKVLDKSNNSETFDIIVPPGYSIVKLQLTGGSDFVKNSSLEIANDLFTPEVEILTSIPFILPYNNLTISWIGKYHRENNNEIKYSYNLDDRGWTPLDNSIKTELYNLSEDKHNFRVKAILNGVESKVKSINFLVDTVSPVIADEKIIVTPVLNSFGIVESVMVKGMDGAIDEKSIQEITVNGNQVVSNDKGGFDPVEVYLDTDGLNKIRVSVEDNAGNRVFKDFNYETSLISITYPKEGEVVLNAPLTIVGAVPSDMDLDVYVKDPLTTNSNDFNKWKKAKFNGDGTFFVEDIYIHPGSSLKSVKTVLDIKVVTADGREYIRDLTLVAGELRIPIDINFSSSAIEGKNSQTEIRIECSADIDNISSWSIDFNGDGIYEGIDIVSGDNTRTHSWSHTYSTVGSVKPRVRVITRDGQYFSTSKELIIHDSILQASNKVIDKPISLSVAENTDKSHTVFTLYGEAHNAKLDIYTIEKNDVSISERKSQINLLDYAILNPVKIKALDSRSLLIAANNNGTGRIILFKKNEFDQFGYVGDGSFDLAGNEIKDLTADDSYLYITCVNSNTIYKYPYEMGVPLKDSGVTVVPDIPGSADLGESLSIGTDFANIYVADYYNQRVVLLNQSLNVFDYFGSFGVGEGEFLKPSIVKSYGDRLFVYDEGRKDIQVFDKNSNKLLTKLDNNSDSKYFEPDFLIDIADMDIITKEEGDKIYYYGVLFSRSTNKLGLLRLPKWEEYRAKVRNNRIAFVKDKELFISKTTGSDLKKILSSDAIPNIEGSIDYPSLSPDGHKVVFTSRRSLNSGTNTATGSIYNNMYIADVDKPDDIQRIPLGSIDNFEIERPVFNVNGDKVIFSAREEGRNWQIYTYNFETGGVHKLFTSNENARFPYYSPDDRYVVFTTDVDGDEEIEIFDTENTSLRIQVSSNNARDYYPVWSELYPYEITNTNLNIDSKIAFASEKNYKKEIYYVYIARKDGEHPRVVKKSGEDINGDPDSAWIKVSDNNYETNYPCFSGDGSKIVYEATKLNSEILLEKDLKNGSIETQLSVLDGARRPAGMKNKITEFDIETKNGNDVLLTWRKYTDSEVSYYVEYRQDSAESKSARIKVFNQDSIEILDLDVGKKYLFRVFIMENNEEAASSSWRSYVVPAVTAIPTVTADPNNPYLVNLHAWQPNADTKWTYTWLIDNREINAQSSQDYYYEFGTSGSKSIILKAYTSGKTHTSVSDPVYINIVSDIIPVIEYKVSDDTTYVELSAENSKGIKIDSAATTWQISGPGSNPEVLNGSRVIVPLTKFRDKLNVNLTLRRIAVSDQQSTDSIQRSLLIDINYKETKPIITYNVDENNTNLVHFSGQDSLGNIDWPRTSWKISNSGTIIHSEAGVSTLSYDFKEKGTTSEYVISLTVPRQDGLGTATTTSIVSLDPKPIVPKLDYEILTIEQDGNVVGAKLLLSAAKSGGSNIDFSQTRWTVPVASSYGEQATQVGPTAVYNLMNIEESATVEVSLTMMRRGGDDVVTTTEVITLKAGDLPPTKINVNVSSEGTTSTGEMFVLDILNSTGPNIEWEKTLWQFGDVTKTGPVVRIDRVSSTEKGIFRYVCSAYIKGSTKPIVTRGEFNTEAKDIKPVVSINSGDDTNSPYPVNVKKLDVLNTIGMNIDWSRTEWLISDGSSQVIRKAGPNITHAFPFSSAPEVYRVQVNMFLKGDTKPFTAYKSVEVDADYVDIEIIAEKAPKNDEEKAISTDDNKRRFSLKLHSGQSVDISQTSWTFSDNPGVQTGSTVVHFFPESSSNKQYEVTATIKRSLSNGEVEMFTVSDVVTVNGDFIKPIITAREPGGTDGYDLDKEGLRAELIFSVKDSYCNVDTTEFDDKIFWEKTKWSISSGNGGVIQKSGSEVYHIFPAVELDTTYIITAEMFLKDSTISFTTEVTVDIVGEPLTPVISWQHVKNVKIEDKNKIASNTTIRRFDAHESEGSNIDWERCKWNFGDGSPEKFGPVVFHDFPEDKSDKVYNVELTIFRTASNGVKEYATIKQEVQLESNKIIPKIKIIPPTNIDGEFDRDGLYTFTAEDSTGVGIDHEEAQWYFFRLWEDEKNETILDGGMDGNVFSQEYNWIPKQISNGSSQSSGSNSNSGFSFMGFSAGGGSNSSSGTSSGTSYNTDFSLWGKKIKRKISFTKAEEESLVDYFMKYKKITKEKYIYVVLQFYNKTKQGELRKGSYIIEKFDIYKLNQLNNEYIKSKAEEKAKKIAAEKRRYQSRGPKGPRGPRGSVSSSSRSSGGTRRSGASNTGRSRSMSRR